jgi:hypothetical protein
MRFKTRNQMLECGMRVKIHGMILPWQMGPQRLDRETVGQMAGATGQNKVMRRDESLQIQA